MDPDANLIEMRGIVKAALAGGQQVDVQRLAELFDGLDTWLLMGGALPVSWRRAVRA